MGSGESNVATIEIDPSVYRLSAIKKAAYRLGGQGEFTITTNGAGRIVVTMSVYGTCDDAEFLTKEFHRQLLDQELREEIADQTAPIANLLMAQAFSATSLIDATSDKVDFRNDPAHIAEPDRPQ
jgi:His-Xaa-Ser system protein HxsD